MEKKEYIKPEAEELLIDTVQMIATSIGISGDDDGEREADDSDVLVNQRRGKWGNLWYKEDMN